MTPARLARCAAVALALLFSSARAASAAVVETPPVTGTVFEPLRDLSVFSQARIELGAVTWPNGADLAPDAMYEAIRAQGYWEVEA